MFGIDVFDASLGVSLLLALSAGILSFLSPCVLPIVPPYLAYMAGSTMDQVTTGRDRRVIPMAMFFVLGLSTVFLLLGAAATAFGRILLQYQQEMAIGSGVVIIIFGLHFLGVIRIPFLFREARFDAGDQSGSLFGSYVLGLAFAFGWTPCIGPMLGSILSLVAQDASVQRGALMMLFYAAGLGIPFLLAAVFLRRFMAVMVRFRRHMGKVEKVMGGMLIAVGLMLVTGMFSDISFWLLEALPFLQEIG